MILFLMRLSGWLERFFAAAYNLGFINAFRLRVLQRHRPIPEGTSMRVRALGRTVYYRGAADGMTHFFRVNYRILDTPQSPVRFIVDAGANIGAATLRFRHFHQQAKIIALEPEPANFQILSRNVSSDANIFPIQKALWPRECALRIFQPRPLAPRNNAFRVEEHDGDPQPGDVPATTIPSLLNQFAFPEIDILKIDIEGAEYFVFDDSARDWVDKVKVLIFECPDNDRPGSAFRIFNAVAHLPLNCYIQGENLVLIRRDVPWRMRGELFYPLPGN